MKITDVRLTLFAWDGVPATSYGAMTGTFGGEICLGLLSVETDEGVTGHAFLGSASNPATRDAEALVRVAKPILMGADPFERERLGEIMWVRARLMTIRAIGAVDVALWDIAGKVAGLPLNRLMGTYRDEIPAYASSPVLPSPEAFAEEAVRVKERGFAAYKIHPPRGWRESIAVCEAVREAVGDDYTLMLDPVGAYDYPGAVRVGRAIEELGYYWYEDPLHDQDVYNYVKLKQRLDIPIMATEYPEAGLSAYPIWLTERATDYLRGDVAIKGGISTVLKTARLAEAFRMNYEIHHGGNSLNNVANLHLS
ncbi:MAG: enolase C-terminal domain-like protein, partial [Micromonosporaceae bacterium]